MNYLENIRVIHLVAGNQDSLWFFSKMFWAFIVCFPMNVKIHPNARTFLVSDGATKISVVTEKSTEQGEKVEIDEMNMTSCPLRSVIGTPSSFAASNCNK